MRFARSEGRLRSEGGFTLAEVAIGLTVLVIAAVVLVNHLTGNYRSTRAEKERVFAYSKAQSMLSEIQSYVDRGAVQAAIGLDKLDDGVINKPTLTITTDPGGNLVPPDHPLSGNSRRGADWVWSRRISVKPFAGLENRNVRYVTVRIYKKDTQGKDRNIATLSSVVNSVGSAFPSTQVFDVYLLAVENIPGWWVFMEAMVPFVESAITDIESRNPGLELRTHWITKASFGRNQLYRPLINESVESTQPMRRAYYYPGLMPAGNSSTFYYVPDMIDARINVDGTERHGYDSNTNPYPYALADFYNHAMRYPREKAYHDARVQEVVQREQAIAAAVAAGNPPPAELDDMSKEPTLRLLLEDLATDPDKYRNAMIINLHGELLPMPSLRNYSDPAKSPALLPEVRVVTHPEELRTRRDPAGAGIDDVKLRVYAYTTDPDGYAGPAVMPATSPIVLQVMDLDLTDPSSPSGLIPGVTIESLRGGVPVGGDTAYYPLAAAKRSGDPTLQTDEMYYDVQLVNTGPGQRYTRIELYRTPVIAPYDDADGDGIWQGLENSTRSRLYDLEYVPSCTEAALDFSRDLAANGPGPKNTARWVVTVPGTVFSGARFLDTSGSYHDPAQDVVLTVRTRILNPALPDPMRSGTAWPVPANLAEYDPDNFSETYTWWADSAADVPITERSQFQGDPRHNPYKDLWDGDPDFPDGYNWYHDSLANDGVTAYDDYPGIDGSLLANRWQGEPRQDVPRFFELLRTGLVASNAVYTTLTGYSYYYMGHGNEIGYDAANGYPTSIPCNRGPWYTDPFGSINVNNITSFRCYVRNGDTPYWWGMPWLGELYPDHVFVAQWIGLDPGGDPRGNLEAAGFSPNHFVRWQDYSTYWWSQNRAWGTRLYTGHQRTNTRGARSFFNIDTPGIFDHLFYTGTGNLVQAGSEIGSNYNFPIPPTAPINRPFTLSGSGSAAHFNSPPYSTERYTASLLETYYDHPSGNFGSGLVSLVDPTGSDSAYVVVNGISNAVASGSSFIAKWSLLTMVHSLLEGGDPALTHRIEMPPRVEIQSPTEITELDDPSSVDVQFDVFWRRWDGLPYTTTMPVGFSESENDLEYVLMYSRDNGTSWQHVQDDSTATPGTNPGAPYVLPDAGAGTETVTWSTPATGTPSSSFPEGSYVIRVESYRQGQSLHYSQHQAKIYISR